MGVLALSPAFGASGFLTTKKAKRLFITKKAANTRFAGRSDVYSKADADARFLGKTEGDAKYLGKTEGDAKYLPAEASTQLQVPPQSWVSKDGNKPEAAVLYEPGSSALSSEGTDQVFLAGVTLPSKLQGRTVRVDGFELCYDAGSSAVLSDVFLGRTFANDSESGVQTLIDDEVDRTDTTCRTYSAGNPISLSPSQGNRCRCSRRLPLRPKRDRHLSTHIELEHVEGWRQQAAARKVTPSKPKIVIGPTVSVRGTTSPAVEMSTTPGSSTPAIAAGSKTR